MICDFVQRGEQAIRKMEAMTHPLWWPTKEEFEAAKLRHESRRWRYDVVIVPSENGSADPVSVIIVIENV